MCAVVTQAKVVDRLEKCSFKEIRLMCGIFKQPVPATSADKVLFAMVAQREADCASDLLQDDVIRTTLIGFLKAPSGKKGKPPPKRKAPSKPATKKTKAAGGDDDDEGEEVSC